MAGLNDFINALDLASSEMMLPDVLTSKKGRSALARASTKRLVGTAQAGMNLRDALVGEAPESKKVRKGLSDILQESSNQADADNYGSEAFAGILGDPLTYIPMGGLSKATTLPQAMLSGAKLGAKSGAIAGFTNPVDEMSTLWDNIKNSGVQGTIGGVLGGTIPVVPAALSKGKELAGRAYNRISSLLGSDKASKALVNQDIVQSLLDDGFSPEQIAEVLKKKNPAGLTVGEMFDTRNLKGREGQILRGSDTASDTLEKAIINRNENTAPNAISVFVDDINKNTVVSQKDDLYQQVRDEINSRLETVYTPYQTTSSVLDASGKPMMKMGVNSSITNKAGELKINAALNDIDRQIASYGSESGDVGLDTLLHVKSILNNVKEQGFTADALLNANQRLNAQYIKNAQGGVQRVTNSHTLGAKDAVKSILNEAAPQTFAKANTAAMGSIAMRDIEEALQTSDVGKLKQFYNKVWDDPQTRANYLRMMPDDASRAKLTELGDSLEKMVKGGWGDKTRSIPLVDDINDAIPTSLSSAKTAVVRGLGAAPTGYRNAMADIFMNPNADDIIKQAGIENIRGSIAKSPVVQALSNVVGTSIDKGYEPMPQEVVSPLRTNSEINTDPFADLVPTAKDPFSDLVPQQDDPFSDLIPKNKSSSYLDKVSMLESSGNPNAKADTSSATGEYQFTDPTWRAMVKKYGAEYGISFNDKNDPAKQRTMADLLAQENADYLSDKGFTVDDTTKYLAHFLGAPATSKVLSNPQRYAADLLPDAAQANRNIFYKNGRPRTGNELVNEIARKYSNI